MGFVPSTPSRPDDGCYNRAVKYLLRYETDPEQLHRAGELVTRHREQWGRFVADGTLLAIGPMADPLQGALAVFATRESAESFAAVDPFVTEGLVARWELLEWNEVLLPERGV
jgi:uncharacterized protein YciI